MPPDRMNKELTKEQFKMEDTILKMIIKSDWGSMSVSDTIKACIRALTWSLSKDFTKLFKKKKKLIDQLKTFKNKKSIYKTVNWPQNVSSG